jgi:LacI family transcriptional regulator
MAKMIEVAHATKLSLSTVSEILSGKPGYNDETRALVHAAARRLNYKPNPISRALTGGSSMSIGLFVTSKATVYTVARRVEAIIQEAAKSGYHVFITYATGNPEKFEEECLAFSQDMINRRVDGLIFHGRIPRPTQTYLKKQGLSAVFIDSASTGDSEALTINRAKGIRQAARHLYSLGHREVAVALNPGTTGKKSSREKVYRQELTAAGLAMVTSPEWMGLVDSSSSDEFYESYLRAARKRNLPSALMLNNDEAAFLAIAALRDAGYRVPDDISIVGFDGLPLARHFSPALTTISVPCALVGIQAFERLAAKIKAPTEKAGTMEFDTELIIRETTARACSPSAKVAAA